MRCHHTEMIDAIKNILQADPYRYWSKIQLSKAVSARTGVKDTGRINQVVLTLVAAGILSGSLRGAQAVGIQMRTQMADGDQEQTETNSGPEAVRRLQDQNKSLIAEREKAYQAAKDVVLEAEKRIRLAEEEAKKASENVVRVELKRPGKKTKITKGLFHAQFKRILTLCKARMNVFIYGPTGCGKSHICSQVAESLDLPFSFVSCTSGMSEGVLGGRLLPTGDSGRFEYVISEFIKAYEKGGVFLLDEIDAADPNVLLIVNAALANGKMAVPNRPDKPYAKRHADFICIAAANTVGTGADRLYSGRNKLDAATLDRFQIGKVVMGYDERVEKELCPDDELRAILHAYRAGINAHRLERAMSTRFMRDAYAMKTEHEWKAADIDEAFFSGWREDEVNKVKSYRS